LKNQKWIFLVLVCGIGLLFIGCESGSTGAAATKTEFAKNHGISDIPDDVSQRNILQVAAASPDHTTLVAAVQAAELQNVLANPGPLTVFAPNNAAFEKLPPGTVEDLLKPENKQTLATIITGHASPGTYAGDLLKDGSTLYMATGHYVDVEVKDDGTYVNGAKILGTVDAANGVVHVIEEIFLF